MARTQTVSDEEILAAAREVFERRGMHGFTLSDVASEIGLSRAAVILRFESTHKLKVELMTRVVDEFIHDLKSLPNSPGGDSLLEVATFIGEHARNRATLPIFLADYAADMDDSELGALERKRGEALHRVILNLMPQIHIDRESAATAFGTHLTGTIINWVAVEETDWRAFFQTRTKVWLRLAGIPFSDDMPGNRKKSVSRKKAAVKKAKGKAKRRAKLD
jgi:TetR/AcrR family macrolide resistance operon transcriptional repressor